MRRLQIFLALSLLVLEVIWLSLQPIQSPHAVLAAGMTASVEQEAHMITLRLRGHPAGAPPRVTVMAGDRNLDSYLRFRDERETETSVRLSYAGVNMFPARVLTYRWEVDGHEVTGEHMYVHPNFPFRWVREEHGPFIFYHTGTLTAEHATQWADLYTDLAALLGLKPVEKTIYLLPDIDALQKALGSDVKERRVAGLWIESLDAMLLSGDHHPVVLRKIVYHEMAHALLVNRNLPWWEEGIATWIESRGLPRYGVWDGSLLFPDRFVALQQVMLTEGTFLSRANASQKTPLDPYTVGFSFCLYIEDRFGKEAVLRLARAAAERPLAEAAKATLGEDLDQLEVGWQEFVKSGRHLQALKGQ